MRGEFEKDDTGSGVDDESEDEEEEEEEEEEYEEEEGEEEEWAVEAGRRGGREWRAAGDDDDDDDDDDEDAAAAAAYQKLESHEVFKRARAPPELRSSADAAEGGRPRLAVNLTACDGRGRLFVWDSDSRQLHFVELQRLESLRRADARTLFAKSHFQTVQLNSPVDFQVLHLAFNSTGRSLVLAGDEALMVVNLLSPTSAASSGPCRVQRIGEERIFSNGNGKWLRILQIGWHPHSDTHLGVLSSDGCFRLFDLSIDAESAEQEYYLQSLSPGKTLSAALVRPLAFAFGGEHLWDRFTVFVLYNDGSIFALCPIVPFGSIFSGAAVDELAKDARHVESLGGDGFQGTANSVGLGHAWLEAVFPSLSAFTDGLSGESLGQSHVLKAHAYVPLDASLSLQGPLTRLSRRVAEGEKLGILEEQTSGISGQAVGLLYNVVDRDSVLAISTKDGKVQVYVLADEIHPTWDLGKPPQLTVDAEGHILAVGMLVSPYNDDVTPASQQKGNERGPSSPAWPSRTPPLLQLAVVDLALKPEVSKAGPTVLFIDPVVPKRLFCQHSGGIDAIFLQWLPFSDHSVDKGSLEAPPLVFPVLDIYPTGTTAPRPLLGVTFILDSLGESWILALTANSECAVVNIKPRRTALPEPFVLDEQWSNDEQVPQALEAGVFQMMSRELLLGPKDIPLTQLTSSSAPLTQDSIEGRAFLHDQCKLLREKYIEYAHRVFVEVASHGTRLHDIVQAQQQAVKNTDERLGQSQRDADTLAERIKRAILKNRELERRVKHCCTLPGVSEKPLTHAERAFKSHLDAMNLQDLDILNSAVEVLSLRSVRVSGAQVHASPRLGPSQRSKNVGVPDIQMRRLKTAVEHLSHVVGESSRKLQLIDESVSHRELLRDR